MRKLGMKIAVAAAVFCMAMPFASFAGTWKSDANGMWYQFDDGSYPKGRWAWIDTDNDGMAESFYFDSKFPNVTSPSKSFSLYEDSGGDAAQVSDIVG